MTATKQAESGEGIGPVDLTDLTALEVQLVTLLATGSSVKEVAAQQGRLPAVVDGDVAALQRRLGAASTCHLLALLILEDRVDRRPLEAELAVCGRRDTEALPDRELYLWRGIAAGRPISQAAQAAQRDTQWGYRKVEELCRWWKATPETIVAVLALAGSVRLCDVRPGTAAPAEPPVPRAPVRRRRPRQPVARPEPARAAIAQQRRPTRQGAVAGTGAALARHGQAVVHAPRPDLRPLAAAVIRQVLPPGARVVVSVPTARALVPAVEAWLALHCPGTTVLGIHHPGEAADIGHRPPGAALLADPLGVLEHGGRLRPLIAIASPGGLETLAATHARYPGLPAWDLLCIEDPLAPAPASTPLIPAFRQLALLTVTSLVANDRTGRIRLEPGAFGPVALTVPPIVPSCYRLKVPVITRPAPQNPGARPTPVPVRDELLRIAREHQLQTLLVVTPTPDQSRRIVAGLPRPDDQRPIGAAPQVTGAFYDARQTWGRRAAALAALEPRRAGLSILATSDPLRPPHPVDGLLLLGTPRSSHHTATVLDHVLAGYRGQLARRTLMIVPLLADPADPGTTAVLDPTALRPVEAVVQALAALDPQLRTSLNRALDPAASPLAAERALHWLTVSGTDLPPAVAQQVAAAALRADTVRAQAPLPPNRDNARRPSAAPEQSTAGAPTDPPPGEQRPGTEPTSIQATASGSTPTAATATPGPSARDRQRQLSVAGVVLGAFLREVREAQGVTTHGAASSLGCSAASIRRVEAGRTRLTLRRLNQLLDLYWVTDTALRWELHYLQAHMSARGLPFVDCGAHRLARLGALAGSASWARIACGRLPPRTAPSASPPRERAPARAARRGRRTRRPSVSVVARRPRCSWTKACCSGRAPQPSPWSTWTACARRSSRSGRSC